MSLSPPATGGSRDLLVRAAGLVTFVAYACAIGWLIAGQPKTVAEVSGGLTSQVGLYRIDQASFDEGIGFFRADKQIEARLAFARADPAKRDATTQFYEAYSFYRQGWGRLYNDDSLFRQALDALDRADRNAGGGRVIVNDPALGLQSSDELRAELERGLTKDLSDLNPMRVFRERK